jgi:gluconolactonase
MTTGFDQILPPTSQLEQIASGLRFTEGPLWSQAEGCLYFSDIPASKIYRWTRATGAQVFRDPSGRSNGLTFDLQGRLLACEHANRRVSLTTPGGTLALAERYQGKRLNSPNDIVVRSDGSIFFTDPPYGLTDGPGAPAIAELPFHGVYRISPDGQALTLLVDDFDRPNGLAFSPDERQLYIDDTSRIHIRVFDVSPQGELANGRVFAEMQPDRPGRPDGMKVDVTGNVYCTGPGGVHVFDPQGRPLGRIDTPETAANIAFGEADWRTLFITAQTSVYRLRLAIPGIPVPTQAGH